MTELDGPTTSNNKFSGPIGKLITTKVTSLKVKKTIPKLDIEINMIDLDKNKDKKIIKSLSQDQKYLYEITMAIKSGVFPTDMKDRGI